MLQTEMTFARAERDAGIARSIDHADRVEPSWGDMALDQIRAYAAMRQEAFISEELTDWAASQGFASPADSRAWGAPFRKAASLGIIRRVGYGVSARRHLSPCPLWRSRVYGEGV